MQLDLNSEEAAVLADVLDSVLGEMRVEIYKAEVADYKAQLKTRESLLSGLLTRIQSGQRVS